MEKDAGLRDGLILTQEELQEKLDEAYDLGYQSCLNYKGLTWTEAEELQRYRESMRPHGRWLTEFYSHQDYSTGECDEEYYIRCSVCCRVVKDINQIDAMFGDWQKIFEKYPYCHCGAKMDLKEAEA